jgi:hypothetical protein
MFKNISHDSISLTFTFLELDDLIKIKQVSKEMKKLIETRSHLINNATKHEMLESYPQLDKALYYKEGKNFKIDWIDVYKNKSTPELINLLQSFYENLY